MTRISTVLQDGDGEWKGRPRQVRPGLPSDRSFPVLCHVHLDLGVSNKLSSFPQSDSAGRTCRHLAARALKRKFGGHLETAPTPSPLLHPRPPSSVLASPAWDLLSRFLCPLLSRLLLLLLPFHPRYPRLFLFKLLSSLLSSLLLLPFFPRLFLSKLLSPLLSSLLLLPLLPCFLLSKFLFPFPPFILCLSCLLCSLFCQLPILFHLSSCFCSLTVSFCFLPLLLPPRLSPCFHRYGKLCAHNLGSSISQLSAKSLELGFLCPIFRLSYNTARSSPSGTPLSPFLLLWRDTTAK